MPITARFFSSPNTPSPSASRRSSKNPSDSDPGFDAALSAAQQNTPHAQSEPSSLDPAKAPAPDANSSAAQPAVLSGKDHKTQNKADGSDAGAASASTPDAPQPSNETAPAAPAKSTPADTDTDPSANAPAPANPAMPTVPTPAALALQAALTAQITPAPLPAPPAKPSTIAAPTTPPAPGNTPTSAKIIATNANLPSTNPSIPSSASTPTTGSTPTSASAPAPASTAASASPPTSPAANSQAAKPAAEKSIDNSATLSAAPTTTPASAPARSATPADASPENAAGATTPTPATAKKGDKSAAQATEKSVDDSASPSTPVPTADASSTTVAVLAAAAQITPAAAPVARPISSPDSSSHADNSTAALAGASSDTASVKTIIADRAASASSAQQSPPADPSQVFDQVVLGLRGKIDAHNGKAEIRLDPPNLGTVRVSITLAQGSLTAQFQTSSDAVRDLLKGNMEKLKTVLESQGVSVDKLAVDSSAAKPVAPVAANTPSTHDAANNGRSAGQYRQNGSGQRRSQKDSSTFARAWHAAVADAAPIDVVA